MLNVNDHHPAQRIPADSFLGQGTGGGPEETRRWQELVCRIHNGQEPFSSLVTELQGHLYARINLILWNPDDTWDALQDCFLKLHHLLPSIDPRRNVRALFYRIARNQAISYLRRRRIRARRLRSLEAWRCPTEDGYTIDLPDPRAVDPVACALAAEAEDRKCELHQQALRAFLQLRKSHRRVLYLFYVKQLNYDELAGRLGLPKTAIGPLLFRARKSLARLLEGAWAEWQESLS